MEYFSVIRALRWERERVWTLMRYDIDVCILLDLKGHYSAGTIRVEVVSVSTGLDISSVGVTGASSWTLWPTRAWTRTSARWTTGAATRCAQTRRAPGSAGQNYDEAISIMERFLIKCYQATAKMLPNEKYPFKCLVILDIIANVYQSSILNMVTTFIFFSKTKQNIYHLFTHSLDILSYL